MATPIPDNRAELSLADVLTATGGELLSGDRGAVVRGVTTDTRGDVKGKLFVALAGESFDGHEFVARAVRAGATAALVSRDFEVLGDVAVVRVADTLTALGDLAGFHRRRWGGQVVAVAGSAGKTTTRSAISAALGAILGAALHRTAGNLNNLVGVPMVLLGLEPQHRVAVLEIGTNARGEVARLAEIADPDVGVLTLVGMEHSEGIGDLDAIEAEEGDLLRALSSQAVAVGNGDDERVRRQLEASPAGRRVTYGSAGADYRLVRRETDDELGTQLTVARPSGDQVTLTTRLVGLPGALAAMAAVAVADAVLEAPADPELLRTGLAGQDVGERGRLTPVALANGTLVLDDSYNANPPSVLSAASVAQEIAERRGARLVLVVGEMRELGAMSEREHRAVGAALAERRAAALVAVEGDARLYVEPARSAGMDAEFATDAEAAVPLVLSRVRPGDVVLVKASRGVRAERIVAALEGGAT
ncbi:MAG: UDP-N-acetylmuramoyl-tripeptide--D-alanyl-D-alanine ligase [Myxococcales bacterium]|nr:UDP-N-acetylmuramoyl-tripeptide--D-alanyl-D-alanine ligase [Myxococcales bacterium]MCB9577976.1 UDP-N-acetylmuramoyl-tripeptide--D-alanyl-D-alanine ligase [Polyangiaceae bacterium]